MELGPIQKQWIADLRANPEKQASGCLGEMQGGVWRYCCLGQGLITICNIEGMKPSILNMAYKVRLIDSELSQDECGDQGVLSKSFEKLGLRDSVGGFRYNERVFFPETGATYGALTEMNDNGMTWLQIADFIEANPTTVFTESK